MFSQSNLYQALLHIVDTFRPPGGEMVPIETASVQYGANETSKIAVHLNGHLLHKFNIEILEDDTSSRMEPDDWCTQLQEALTNGRAEMIDRMSDYVDKHGLSSVYYSVEAFK